MNKHPEVDLPELPLVTEKLVEPPTDPGTYHAGNEFGGANKISAKDIEAGYAKNPVIQLRPAISTVQTPVSGSAAVVIIMATRERLKKKS